MIPYRSLSSLSHAPLLKPTILILPPLSTRKPASADDTRKAEPLLFRRRRGVSLLALSTRLLMRNPLLLDLSPLMLLISLIASIPFVTLILRLLLFGYFYRLSPDASLFECHLKEWAGWAIAGTVFTWLWSWGVGRGILRTTCAGVVGAWYFNPYAIFFFSFATLLRSPQYLFYFQRSGGFPLTCFPPLQPKLSDIT